MRELALGAAPVPLAAFVAAMAGPVRPVLDAAAWDRIAAARALVDRFAGGEVPVYGLNTGLGGNLAHRIAPAEMAGVQDQILAARSVGLGPVLSESQSRGALLARVIGAARGASGLGPELVTLMVEMLARGLAPVIAGRGSIGAGDLVLAAQMGATLLGRGEVWQGGRRLPADQGLAAVGLRPAVLGPKDALALANHSAITVAQAAEAAAETGRLIDLGAGVAALSGEGFAMNLGVFAADLNALRPAAGQAAAAAWFRAAFAGSSLTSAAARRVQDPLSFRTLAPVFGAVRTAQAALVREVEVELNGAADSPAAWGDDLRSTANFHTPALALALDALAIGQVMLATASAQRLVKLMAPDLSGLPRYLSPVGGASAGYVPLQKTAAALLAEVRLGATPASLDAMVVSEMVEDVAPQTPLAARKLSLQSAAMAQMWTLEALVAAQAVDLRTPPRLGAAGAMVQAAVRAAVPPLGPDRATVDDLVALAAALAAPALARDLGALG